MKNYQEIKELILKRGITVGKFCEEIGILRQSLYNHFNGKQNMRKKNVRKLAKVLKLKSTDIYDI